MHLPRNIHWLSCAFLAVTGCERTEVAPPEEWERPDNDWSISAPPPGLVGEGFEIGQVIPDVRLVDQHGEVVSLWQFWGDVVLVTVSAVWCRPCHDLAIEAEEACDAFASSGVTLLTILEEDGGGLAPEVEDAVEWVEMFDIESPVLVDPEHALSPALQGSYPSVLLLDRELVIVARAHELSAGNLHDLIESEL